VVLKKAACKGEGRDKSFEKGKWTPDEENRCNEIRRDKLN
jgi:hypothetical protein